MTLVRIAAALAAVALVACAALPATDGGCATADCAEIFPDSGTSADGFAPSSDAGASDANAPTTDLRSSLCGSGCKPDDALACVGDAGTSASDAAIQSCRMILGTNQSTSALCAASGTGIDGASCTSGADCAVGFECVGTGTCRHYCCDDTACTTLTNASQDYETYFCDVATEKSATGAKVPVCLAVQACQPLKGDMCGAGSACTVVEIDDAQKLVATCDATGDAVLDESCETAHCAAGFACIGAIGQRTCQELCDNQHPCDGSLNCNMKSQALNQFGIGICGP